LSCTFSKDELKARIEIPALIPGSDFFPVDNYPIYRWQATLATIPDLFYDDKMGYIPNAIPTLQHGAGIEIEWCAVKTNAPSRIIDLTFLLNLLQIYPLALCWLPELVLEQWHQGMDNK